MDQPEHWLIRDASRIPDEVRHDILKNRRIDLAVNVHEFGTHMEFLFDAYEEFIDLPHQYGDYACHVCRQHIVDEFKKLKPYLEKLENAT